MGLWVAAIKATKPREKAYKLSDCNGLPTLDPVWRSLLAHELSPSW